MKLYRILLNSGKSVETLRQKQKRMMKEFWKKENGHLHDFCSSTLPKQGEGILPTFAMRSTQTQCSISRRVFVRVYSQTHAPLALTDGMVRIHWRPNLDMARWTCKCKFPLCVSSLWAGKILILILNWIICKSLSAQSCSESCLSRSYTAAPVSLWVVTNAITPGSVISNELGFGWRDEPRFGQHRWISHSEVATNFGHCENRSFR